jgi:TRAP-type C4-dicarboxylate transport system permease small subunit
MPGPAGRFVLGLSRGIDRLAGAATMFFLVALVGAVMVQVVARYILNSPPPWTEEMARYAMIWAGLMGATLSFKRRFDPALINREARARQRGPRAAMLAAIAGAFQGLVVMIYLLPILWHSFFGPNMNPERSFLMRHSRMTAETLGFPTVLVAIAVPLMAIFILVHLAARAFEDEAAQIKPEHAGEDPLNS